jgi:hypothetical protein
MIGVSRYLKHRAGNPDAGIVDETGERLAVQRAAHLACRRQHRGFVGDVEQQRDEIGAELGFEAVGVGLVADAAEHAEAAIEQQFCGSPADTGGRAGDDDRFHDEIPFPDGFPAFCAERPVLKLTRPRMMSCA